MSITRRLFEDPRNSYLVDNDDRGAFNKRFPDRPEVHREQGCWGDRAPVWQTYTIRDGEDPGAGNRPAPKTMAALQKAGPIFVGLSPDAALSLAEKENVTVDFVQAQSADDVSSVTDRR